MTIEHTTELDSDCIERMSTKVAVLLGELPEDERLQHLYAVLVMTVAHAIRVTKIDEEELSDRTYDYMNAALAIAKRRSIEDN